MIYLMSAASQSGFGKTQQSHWLPMPVWLKYRRSHSVSGWISTAALHNRNSRAHRGSENCLPMVDYKDQRCYSPATSETIRLCLAVMESFYGEEKYPGIVPGWRTHYFSRQMSIH